MDEIEAILPFPVNNEAADAFLRKKIGAKSVCFYDNVFGIVRLACPGYTGGLWEIIGLSNGGFYAKAPLSSETDCVKVVWGPNYFDGHMSIDALSLAISTMAINHMLFDLCPDSEVSGLCHQAYESLSDYIVQHAEHSVISRFLD